MNPFIPDTEAERAGMVTLGLRRRNAHPESDLQQAIVRHLASRGYWAVAVPNGARIAGTAKQRGMRVAYMKREGLYPGFPDLAVLFDGGCVGFIEVKAEGGYQSAVQKACQARLEALDHRYAVCRSIADVDETLSQWGVA